MKRMKSTFPETQSTDTEDQDLLMEEEYSRPSKTRQKKEAKEQQAIGEKLMTLTNSEFEKIPMPDNLKDAVLLAKRIKSYEGLRRQKQLIGKIMRQIDCEPIEIALDGLENKHVEDNIKFHKVEKLVERLLSEPDKVYNELSNLSSEIDLQYVRQLLRNASKEKELDKASKSRKLLFKYLRDFI